VAVFTGRELSRHLFNLLNFGLHSVELDRDFQLKIGKGLSPILHISNLVIELV